MSRVPLRLWDPLVRLFHVSIAGVFVANYFFNEVGDDWHVWLGYYAVAWLTVRVVWGFVGPPSARWSDFWPTAERLLRAHIRSLTKRQPMHRL
ncbi:cytochrome b/b6 domain-containing protein, partial [Pseudomonas coronafaciens]|uniref:cytochrome b/b6 domain-containing protein n=1 Tax=Pseudomonas coronafaciens TaxID=53409 RepID=UPI000F3D1958